MELGGQKGYVLRASQGSASTAQWAQWFIEFGTPRQFVFYATIISRDGSSNWLAETLEAVKTVKFNMSKIESEIQAPKLFTISLQRPRAAAKSQLNIIGKNGFHQAIQNSVWYGFSAKARVELRGLSYTKILSDKNIRAGEELKFTVPDDIILGDYKLTVFDFSDDT